MQRRVFSWFCLLVLACGCPSAARAELPWIELHRIEPLGGGAGSTVEVVVQGRHDEEAQQLRFEHPGISAKFLEPKRFEVTIAADVPAGTYDARLVGRFGVSNPRLFAVSLGLEEVAEANKNHTIETAQPIQIQSAVNAVTNGNERDMFRFAANAGQRIVIECQAGKLDSQLDAVLAVTDLEGRRLAGNSDYYGRDPLIDFVVPGDGQYVVALHDLSYRGGHRYRLLVTNRPQVDHVFPRAIQVGKPTSLMAYGRNLGSAATISDWKIDEVALEQLDFELNAPPEIVERGQFRFFDHPVDHTVMPTAATCTLTGMQVHPQLDRSASRGQNVLVCREPVVIEAEPNDKPDAAQAITAPLVLSGRFDRPRDVDYFELQGSESADYALEVYCERIAGRADPYLLLTDEKGNTVQELDDYGHRVNGFDGHLRDPVGTQRLNKDRKYRVTVGDRYGRGGAQYQYLLAIRPARPDFFVAVMHRQNPTPTGLTVWKGGAEYLGVVIHRRDNHRGPITLTAKNLPPGVHAAPTTIHDGTRGTFVIWADPSAAEWIGEIQLEATGEGPDGRQIVRDVRPYTRVWQQANFNSSRPMRQLILAVGERAPFVVSVEPPEAKVAAGQKLSVAAVARRYWPDFQAPIRITPLEFENHFKLAATDIVSDRKQIEIQVQPNAQPGRYTMALQCQAQVPFDKNPAAEKRSNTLVTLPSLPLTIEVVEPPKGE